MTIHPEAICHAEIAVASLEMTVYSFLLDELGRRKYPPPSPTGPTAEHVLCYILCRLDYLEAIIRGVSAETAYADYCECCDACDLAHQGPGQNP